jgi:hypothetical protein
MSTVIHRPQGTVLLMLVTTKPLVRTKKAEVKPMARQSPMKANQARNPGVKIEGFRICVAETIALTPPWA